jgi:penicillin-binding protein A
MVRLFKIKHQAAGAICIAALVTSNAAGVSTSPIESAALTRIAPNFNIVLNNDLPQIADASGTLHSTTLNPSLQLKMQAFIAERGAPISSVVVVDVRTGAILTMAQGRAPEKWGSTTHTALYNRFPAASLFKTVVSTAALEMTPTNPDKLFGLHGGCGGQDITPTAAWMNDRGGDSMTLRRAFGHSCNGFFAKLAVNQLGIGAITHFAKFFGWEKAIPIDFALEPSNMMPPTASNSTTHTVGRFAAGFGLVSISPLHAAWMATLIANKGYSKPLNLFLDSPKAAPAPAAPPIFSLQTAGQLVDIMRSTVDNGTASRTFDKGRYRSIAQDVGGKTGTLNGRTPEGITSLFIGIYPINAPRIAVASIVVLQDRYLFKAPQLAAEAILAWKEQNDQSSHATR